MKRASDLGMEVAEKVGDSPLEQAGFEPSVPGGRRTYDT